MSIRKCWGFASLQLKQAVDISGNILKCPKAFLLESLLAHEEAALDEGLMDLDLTTGVIEFDLQLLNLSTFDSTRSPEDVFVHGFELSLGIGFPDDTIEANGFGGLFHGRPAFWSGVKAPGKDGFEEGGFCKRLSFLSTLFFEDLENIGLTTSVTEQGINDLAFCEPVPDDFAVKDFDQHDHHRPDV